MKSVKDFIPLIIATVIALIITILVRFILPGGSIINSVQRKTEVSMPDIPLMVKESEAKFVQVLFVTSNINQGQKITQDKLAWKKWPEESLQPYFIAKTADGSVLNNSADYSNALKMWAKSDIPQGVPLTMQMLINEDPIAKAEMERKKKQQEEELKKRKKEEEEKKREEEKKKEVSKIAKGMRAVTFQVDPKNAISSGMLFTGDYIDVLIMENSGNLAKMHKYKSIKILAVDGAEKSRDTEHVRKKSNALDSGFISNISNMVSTAPKSITLEIKEHLVETMLKRSADRGIIILLRNSEDNEDDAEENEINANNDVETVFLHGISTMNRDSSADLMMLNKASSRANEEAAAALLKNMQSNVTSKNVMLDSKRDEIMREREVSSLIRSMSSNINSSDMFKMHKSVSGEDNNVMHHIKSLGADITGSKIEFVSGKSVGDEPGEVKNTVTIYRKLTPNEVVFDENGRKVSASNDRSNVQVDRANMNLGK